LSPGEEVPDAFGAREAAMANQSVLVRVPATVGNFGGAVDCAALALDAHLNVKVTPRLDGHAGIRYFGEDGERVPRDRSNLVVRAMEAALHLKQLEFTGADFEIYSSVPVAVGLGSSTAAVMAGIIAADQLFRLGLDEKTIFDLASIYEDRQDSLRAAWLGGFVTCAEEAAALAHRRTVVPENFALQVVVPEAPLVPGARQAPARSAKSDPQNHRKRAAAFSEFFAEPGNRHAQRVSELLPPTCEKVVPGLEDALKVRLSGVLSVFVCGSGPAVGILAQENAGQAVEAVRECFARRGVESSKCEFRPTNAGAQDWNAISPEIALPRRMSPGLGAALPKSSPFPA
jgi:homoserine kinase